MKSKAQFLTSLRVTSFGVLVLFSSSDLLAQVKIGTNPTTISANSNLEVEASTSGRKTSVHKTTGQVSIADGTEGNKKVFTSDAAGGGSWQLVGPASIAKLPKAKISGASTPVLPYGGNTTILFSGVEFTEGGMLATATSNAITVTTAGYYLVILNIAVNNEGAGCAGSAIVSAAGGIRVNGNIVQAFDDKITIRSKEGSIFNVPVLLKLNAGDGISASMDNMFFTADVGGCSTKVNSGSLSAHYEP